MRRLAPFVAAALALVAAGAAAHPLDPGLLDVVEQAERGHFVARFRPPRAAPALRPLWPAGCRESAGDDPAESVLACDADALAGAAIGFAGLEASAADVFARVRFADGRSLARWLDAGDPALVLPARSGAAALFAEHVELGAAHLLGGLDHVLFVAGLVALLRRGRALWIAVSAFTAGHCVTLACAAFGVVRVPAAAIEPAIAATLVWLAFELARRAEGTSDASGLSRRPLALPFAFGLLHGLGFASALAWLGVARAELPIALAGFNTGIEVAQLALVVLLRLGVAPLGSLLPRALASRAAALAPVYAIGTLGVYWLVARIAAIATGL